MAIAGNLYGGKTWGGPRVLSDSGQVTARVTRLSFVKDGRLVATDGIALVPPKGVTENRLTAL